MVNTVDKRTSFKYLCEVGSSIIPASDLNECLFIAKSYGPCAVYQMRDYPLPDKYLYICDLFIDEALKKEVIK